MREQQLRLTDQAAGAACTGRPLRTSQAYAVLRLLGGCGLRVAELAAGEHGPREQREPEAADGSTGASRPRSAWTWRSCSSRARIASS